jgi:tRNA-2-methylthio-N6-dimethylallyladenosine synthase
MPARSVYIETFGCQMNELDSQLVTGALRALGYRFTRSPDQAQVVLYNTCSVRDHAEQKVRSRLGEMRLRKAEEPSLVVGVLGCMAERDGAAMLARFPVVDVLCGPGELDKLPALLDNAVRTRESMLADHDEALDDASSADRPDAPHPLAFRSARQIALQGAASRRSATLAAAGDSLELLDLSRAVSPDDHSGSAYVRITRGCNKFCSYCVVPNTRGAEIHRPPDHIVEECRRLADAGVIEVTLLGQTVNHYRYEHGSAVTINGLEQPQKGRSYQGGHRRDPFAGERVTTFADLLHRIHEEVPSIARLRFVTSYPRDFGDDVLEVIRHSPRICRYLHVPAQSGSDRMLQAMNRGYTVGEYLEFIQRAREHLHQPEINRPLTIAGDIIAGFCGETDADHQATADLLRRVRYKNCFIFKYSPRPGTTAYGRIPDDVPEETKRRRVNELLALQQEISDEVSREQIGLEFDVFVQGASPRQRKRRRAEARAASTVTLTIAGRDSGGAETDRDACSFDDGALSEAAIDAPLDSDREPSDAVDAEGAPVQLTGRTEGDLIAVFDCPPGTPPQALVGRVVRLRVVGADSLTLHATPA